MVSKYSPWKYITAACLAFGLAIAPLHATAINVHQEHGDSPAKLTLNNGKKWQTDEALRKGMDRIRMSMKTSMPAIHKGTLTNIAYDKLSQQVEKEVKFIVVNCKLDPYADAQLHLIIADIMDGTAAMQGKKVNVSRQEGAAKVLDALNNYASYFDHPNWESIIH